MSFQEKVKETVETVKMVLSRKKYLYTSIITGLVVFATLHYFLVANVADNDIWISVMMSGVGYVTWGVVSSLIISALFGIYLSLVIFKISMVRAMGGGGFLGIFGGVVGSFGVGCPTCGAFVLGLIGAPLALMYLPFRGLELQVLSVFVLFLSIYFVGKSINANCKINRKS